MTVPASGYLDRLAERSSRVGSVLCLGIDPDPAALPDGFPPTVQGIERFAQLILEAGGPAAAAIKPNLAFFEAFGSAGLAVLERLRARVPAALPVILDAKRGDIGSTSARHAAALFDALGADAITVNPYVGEAGLEPLLERADRFVYVLCRTSNPGAGELQNLVVGEAESAPGEPLWARVARRVAGWGPGETCGLVVGATAPTELAAIREIAPDLPFLVPGLGAQGGAIEAVLESGPATRPPAGDRVGGGLVVNVSRGIAGPARDGAEGDRRDPAERIAAAAREWARRLPVLR